MQHVASARMYAVNPIARDAWFALFSWLSDTSGVALTVVEHAFPEPLSSLWSRPDLACAFMCGYPFMQARHRPIPLAAPVYDGAPIYGHPVYATCFIVDAASRFASLEDTFGGRLGYTATESHSGFNAVRHHLLGHVAPGRAPLYGASIGPLHTPRRVVEAILNGSIDVGPLDCQSALNQDP